MDSGKWFIGNTELKQVNHIERESLENGEKLSFSDGLQLICEEKRCYIRGLNSKFELVSSELLTTKLENGEINIVLLKDQKRNRPEYLFEKTRWGVNSPQYGDYYKNWKLFVVTSENDHDEYPIKSVERYKDGGTTIMTSDLGRLFSPTSMSSYNPSFIERILGKMFNLTSSINDEKLNRIVELPYDIPKLKFYPPFLRDKILEDKKPLVNHLLEYVNSVCL